MDKRMTQWTRSPLCMAAAFTAAALVAACGESAPPEERPVRPVDAVRVAAPGAKRIRTFSGTVEASSTVDLSFRVDGAIVSIAVKSGDLLAPGDLVATLDATDYALRVRENEASLAQSRAEERNARANFERVSDLYEEESASLTELDEARAQAESRKAAVRAIEQSLGLSRLQLSYTELRAPERMAVTEVLVDSNENVRAGDPVAIGLMGETPEVKVALPESLIAEVRRGDAVSVRFDAIPDQTFGGVVSELGLSATQGGTTFPVTIQLDESDNRLRAGMAAKTDFTFEASFAGSIIVPTYAVGKDGKGNYVYTLELGGDGLATTRRIDVEVGELTGDGLEVLSGLIGGELIATAGVPRIRAGLTVKPQIAEP